MEKSGGLFRMKGTGPTYYGLGWGVKREKQTIRKMGHEMESGRGEVDGHNNNLCVLFQDEKFSEIKPLVPIHARQSQVSKITRKGLVKKYGGGGVGRSIWKCG